MSNNEIQPVNNKPSVESEEFMLVADHTIHKLADGLSFGHGTIDGDLSQEPDVARALEDALNSPKLLVIIDKDPDTMQMLDDDGCGDGRGVSSVFTLTRKLKKSLNRAKVFGGGVTMATAAIIGLGQSKGNLLVETFDKAASELAKNNVHFGAHTATQKKAGGCGCGAIDEAPQIIGSAVKYEAEIRDVMGALGINLSKANNDLDFIFANYKIEFAALEGQDYQGERVMKDSILGREKVVKELSDSHREVSIILNKKNGYTVDQKFVREATNNRAQVFAVDVWRLERIARGLYPENKDKQRQAFYSELVYTLAAAAVLTKGNLPVYVTEDASETLVEA